MKLRVQIAVHRSDFRNLQQRPVLLVGERSRSALLRRGGIVCRQRSIRARYATRVQTLRSRMRPVTASNFG